MPDLEIEASTYLDSYATWAGGQYRHFNQSLKLIWQQVDIVILTSPELMTILKWCHSTCHGRWTFIRTYRYETRTSIYCFYFRGRDDALQFQLTWL